MKELDEYSSKGIKNDFFISDKLIITEKRVYVTEGIQKEVKNILDHYSTIFDKFLDENKNKLFISHDIYIDWLLSWFPGKIHIRSLEHKR